MIRDGMRTVGETLTAAAARLAPFDRTRVGRVGCFAALIVMGLAIVALAAGWRDAGGSWAAGFRFVVVSGLAAVIVLFVTYAIAEAFVERSVRRSLDTYLRESGETLETLKGAAAMRRDAIPGGARLLDLLEDHARRAARS